MAWRKNSSIAGIIKTTVLPSGIQPRAILTGPLRGIRMELDPQAESQMWLGLAERELSPLLKPLSSGIRSAVDVGAALGEYTLFLLLKTSAERVFSFEPLEDLVPRLRHHLELNGLKDDRRLELHPKFLRSFNSDDSVSADTLAQWIQPPCFIKMDIEGGELEVLRASSRILAMPDIRWLIETHSDDLHRECEALLKSSGYKTRHIQHAWWRGFLPELRRTDNTWLIATR